MDHPIHDLHASALISTNRQWNMELLGDIFSTKMMKQIAYVLVVNETWPD